MELDIDQTSDVLKKSIEKAIKNGMSTGLVDGTSFMSLYAIQKSRRGDRLVREHFRVQDCYGIIFNHEFAKAFWSDGKPLEWLDHLKEMVEYINPAEYLQQFLDDVQGD